MRWLSVILALTGLTSICGAAPTGSSITMENFQSESTSTDTTTSASSSSSSSSSPLPSARKLPTHDVGLPSELAWQAWLVVANKPDAQSSFESATVPRRISPKSVFVAPKFCSDGYTKDVLGRCVKDTIQIDYKNHLEFILSRLRVKFPSRVQLGDSAATGSEQSQSDSSSGPLQVNISLGIEDNLSPSRSPLPSVKSERDVPGVDPSRDVREPDSKTETASTAYEVGNLTNAGKLDEEGTLFRQNSSQPLGDHSIRDVVVPVAEFVDDGNQTFTEVIDYKIPPSLGELFNDSRGKPSHEVKNITKTRPVDDALQPTVVLLLSSTTKLSGAASTPYFKDADSRPETSNDHILVRTGGLLVNSTRIDGIPVNISELDSPSEDTTAGIDEETTLSDDGFERTTTPGVPEIVATTIYPEEDLDDTTELNDEILAPGEAGMLVAAGNFGPSPRPEEGSRPSSPAWVFTSSKTADESGGNISSESSISGDVILETTLLDLNIGTGTASKDTVRDDLRELFEAEEDRDLEPEVIFSSQDAHRLDRPGTRGKKRAEDLATSASTPKESSVMLNQDDSGSRETVPHTSRHKEDDGSSVRGNLQQRRRTTSGQDYVRFPEDQRQSPSSYVLFPSDHSNSINGNPDSKDHSSFADERTHPQLKPKSSVSLHQKKTYWHLPPGWRIDDLQPPRQSSAAVQNGNQRHGQNPMLFRFWTRMPLFRDPSLTMSNQSSRISPIVTQRESSYRAISPVSANRGFLQSTRGGQAIG